MKQRLKFAARKENIGVRERDDGLKGNKVLLAGNRPGKKAAARGFTRGEKDAIADVARAAARAVAPPVQEKKKKKKVKKAKKAVALPVSSPPVRESAPSVPSRSSRADLPRSEAALRAVGRPPSSSSSVSSSSSIASSAGVSSAGGSISSNSSSAGASSAGSSVSSSGSSSGSGSSSSSISLSSLSTVSSVPRDKGFDVLRRGGGAKAPPSHSAPSASSEEEAERIDILARFHALKQRGVKLSKNYTQRSSLGDLRLEMGRIEHESSVQRSVQRLRRWLLAFVSGAQFASDSRYAPKFVHGRLNGFSDYVLASVEDYDAIFERISEEHGGAGGIGSTGSPMLDLGILLGTQLLMFFFMNSKPGVKPPSADEIRRDHPDLVRQVASELATEMRNRERFEERVAQHEPQQYQQQQQQQQQQPQQQSFSSSRGGEAPPQRRTMPAPSFNFADRVPQGFLPRVPQPHQHDETVESLHASTLPTRPWVSVGETLLPADQDEQPRETNQLPSNLPIIVQDIPRAQPETYPAAPPTTKKYVELNENAMSTRKGRPPKNGPVPKPNVTPEQPEQKIIEIL